MRAVYAVSFALPSGSDPDEALSIACGWFCRGQAPGECASWEVGRRSYPLPDDEHTLEIDALASEEGRLWQGTWRHPYADDPDLHLISDVEIGVTADQEVTFSLVIRVVWARSKVAPPRFDLRAPRIVRTIVERFDVGDAGRRLTRAASVLDASAVPEFIDTLLLSPARTRPVIFVSDDPKGMGPNLDPNALASQLAGLAHVYTSMYGRPGWELTQGSASSAATPAASGSGGPGSPRATIRTGIRCCRERRCATGKASTLTSSCSGVSVQRPR